MRLQMEARDLVPEEVVVLETVGTVGEFIRAVEKVPGMEWLAEVETEGIPPDDDFFALAGDGEARSDKDLRGRIFLVFTNQGRPAADGFALGRVAVRQEASTGSGKVENPLSTAS